MHCDECGRAIEKVHRNYQSHRYCSTCYARVFKRKLCPKCGTFAKLPKTISGAICRKCESDKPCVRCGKTEYAIGKITEYGPVCSACRPYFTEAKPCGICGTYSIHLSRVKRLNINTPVCPKCARSDHATCPSCQKYRLLVKSSDGNMLCKKCNDMGDIPCTKCGQQMPAGLGKQCNLCYWGELLLKRTKINNAAFITQNMVKYFEAFSYWLKLKMGERKAAINLNQYLSFFIEIENKWKTIPSYSVLLEYFGRNNLRKVLLPMQWMNDVGLIKVNNVLKEEHAENHRIVALLEKFKIDTKERDIIEGYHQILMEKLSSGKTSLRSLRLSLSCATALLLEGNKTKNSTLDQMALYKYLAKSPGQRANIFGFVKYINRTHDIDIILPKSDSRTMKLNREKKLELELVRLLKSISDDEKFKKQWITISLAYFHGLSKKVANKVRNEDIEYIKSEEIKITWNNKVYWIPSYLNQNIFGKA